MTGSDVIYPQVHKEATAEPAGSISGTRCAQGKEYHRDAQAGQDTFISDLAAGISPQCTAVLPEMWGSRQASTQERNGWERWNKRISNNSKCT